MNNPSSQIEHYSHPSDFPADVGAMFEQTERLDIEAGAPWFANLIDTVVRQPGAVHIYVLRKAGRPVVGLPLLLERQKLGCELRSLGNFYTSLYIPVLAEEATAEDISEVLIAIRTRHPGLRGLRFEPVDPQVSSTKLLREALALAGYLTMPYFSFNNWFLRTNGGDWPSYLAAREGKVRSTIKRMSQKLHSLGGSLEIVQGGPGLEDAIADYQRVYLTSWKRPEPFADFIPGLLRTAAKQGWLRLGIARLEGKAIAAQIWLVHEKRASIFKLAYDEGFKSYSPGTLLTAKLMQLVWEEDQVEIVDYLIGNDAYKKSWMGEYRERVGLLACNPRSVSGLLLYSRELLAHHTKPLRDRLSARANRGRSEPAQETGPAAAGDKPSSVSGQ